MRNTTGFRERRDVEELWEDVVGQLEERVENGIRYEKNGDVLEGVKDVLVPFVGTIEVGDFRECVNKFGGL